MRSMFVSSGIRNPRETSWMGQAATTTDTSWSKDLAKGIEAGAGAFKTYEQEQIAEENRKAEEQKRAAADAAARTAQIQQQTTAMQLNATNKIMGMDKPVFKALLRDAGIPTTRAVVLRKPSEAASAASMPRPTKWRSSAATSSIPTTLCAIGERTVCGCTRCSWVRSRRRSRGVRAVSRACSAS